MIGLAALLIALGSVLRYVPHLISSTFGVDHWFWKLYVRTCRAQHRFPPHLSQYLLDEHQWYPPIFPLAISVWPWATSEHGSVWLPIMVDGVRHGLLLATVSWLTAGDRNSVIVASLVYSLTPILVSYNVQLNPRGLGALLLDTLLVIALWTHISASLEVWPRLAIVLLAGIVLLTHKMTTQLLWFLVVVGAIALRSAALLSLLPLSIVVALIVSGGFYLRVMRAHADIVTFWQRNWRWLQAHPVDESPLFGDPRYETPTKFFRRGIRGVIRHISYLFGFNPWAWLLPLSFLVPGRPFDDVQRLLVVWSVTVLAFAGLTIWIPWLRGLGSGYYYLYNAAFPVALLWAHRSAGSRVGISVAAGVAIIAAIPLGAFYIRLTKRRVDVVDDDFEKALSFLSAAPRGTVWCLPPQWHDIVAYRTGQPVLFGGHGYGFRRLEAVFPRITVSVARICSEYRLRYIVTQVGYLSPQFRSAFDVNEVRSFGKYEVLTIDGAASLNVQARRPPATAAAT